MGAMMEEEANPSEGCAGFMPNRKCVDYLHTLGKLTQV